RPGGMREPQALGPILAVCSLLASAQCREGVQDPGEFIGAEGEEVTGDDRIDLGAGDGTGGLVEEPGGAVPSGWGSHQPWSAMAFQKAAISGAVQVSRSASRPRRA